MPSFEPQTQPPPPPPSPGLAADPPPSQAPSRRQRGRSSACERRDNCPPRRYQKYLCPVAWERECGQFISKNSTGACTRKYRGFGYGQAQTAFPGSNHYSVCTLARTHGPNFVLSCILLSAQPPPPQGRLWHFDMMADLGRNDAYDRALKALVKPEHVVLDIGTGSGLLAMMAARAGAKHVYAIEANESIAEKARKVCPHRRRGGKGFEALPSCRLRLAPRSVPECAACGALPPAVSGSSLQSRGGQWRGRGIVWRGGAVWNDPRGRVAASGRLGVCGMQPPLGDGAQTRCLGGSK